MNSIKDEQLILMIFNKAFRTVFKDGEGISLELNNKKYAVYHQNEGVHIIEHKDENIKDTQGVSVIDTSNIIYN